MSEENMPYRTAVPGELSTFSGIEAYMRTALALLQLAKKETMIYAADCHTILVALIQAQIELDRTVTCARIGEQLASALHDVASALRERA